MPEYPIKLGMSYGGLEAVSAPSQVPEPPEEYFPNVHLEWKQDYELPDEGTITFRYKITREVDDKKAKRNCVDMDLTEIVSASGSKKSVDEYENVSAGLDALKEALEAASE